MSSYKPAERTGVSVIVSLAGPTGSGKTMSALKIAVGLANGGKIAGVDSESGRMLHYAPRPGQQPDNHKSFAFDHAHVRPPFTPQAFLDKILEADAAGYAVILVDNFSHEWEGEGGLHDWADAELEKMVARQAETAKRQNWQYFDEVATAEKLTAKSWIEPKIEHKRVVQRMTQLRAHLVICLRAEEKLEIVQVEDPKNPKKKKTEYRKAQSIHGAEGYVPICEKRFPYEMTISMLVLAERPGFPVAIKMNEQHRPFFPPDKRIDVEAGRQLARWAAGEEVDAPALASSPDEATLTAILASFKVATSIKELQAFGGRAKELPEALKAMATVAYKERLEELKAAAAPAEREPGSEG